MITLTFDDLEKIKRLDRFDNRRVCFDYVDSLSADGDIFQVTVFVEPAGLVARRGKSWSEVLDWWIKVFDTQPENIHSQICGWHLLDLYQKDLLPDDPAACWDDLAPIPLRGYAKAIAIGGEIAYNGDSLSETI